MIVENQVALGDEYPAKGVLLRLMSEGLYRHEAIHAIGSVLSQTLFTALNEPSVNGDFGGDYLEKLKTLSAESWRELAC